MGLSEDAIQRMREAIGDDDLVLADILQSFVDEVDKLVDGLVSSVAKADAVGLRRAAHTLKTSCRDLGDHVTADLCQKLEMEAKTNGAASDGTDAETIRQRCLALKDEVVAYIQALMTRSQGK